MTTYQVASPALKNYKYTENAFLPKQVKVPLCNTDDSEAACLVSEGDLVKEGDVIASEQSEKFGKLYIHSPVPGRVEAIKETVCANGNTKGSVVIRTGGQFSYTGKKLRENDWTAFMPDSLVEKFIENGIMNTFICYEYENLGEQIKRSKKHQEKTLVVRLFDEDKLRNSDSLYTKFFYDQILTGARITAKAAGCQRIVLAMDQGLLKSELPQKKADDKGIIYLGLNSKKYPMGFKRDIVAAFARAFPKESRITDNDLFTDSTTMYQVYKSIVNDIPSVEKYINFSGNCLKSSAFLNVKIGASIRDVIDQLGGLQKQPNLLVVNGLICGNSLGTLDAPLAKYVKSVELIYEMPSFSAENYSYACINCGNCRSVCPAKLAPDILYNHIKFGRTVSEAQSSSSLLCSGCSLCNTACPSRLNLSQTITSLKTKILDGKYERKDY